MSGSEDELSNDPMVMLLAKQRKEKKDMKERILQMKKTAKCGNKAKQKETSNEIENMEKEMIARHEAEIDRITMENRQKSNGNIVRKEKPDGESEDQEEASFYKQIQVTTKKQKMQAKKEDAARRLKEAQMADRQAAANSLKTSEMLAVNKILEEKDLKLVDIRSDGDCLYNAIAHQIGKTKGFEKTNGKDMRRRAAAYIMAHKEEFLPFLSNEDGDEMDEMDFEDYCHKVEQMAENGGVWGGEPEINALSRSLERKIEVIQPEGRILTFGDSYTTKPLVIIYQRHAFQLGEHYNSTDIRSLV